jgi:hypothetical protein
MSVATPGPDAAALAWSASQVLEPVFERLGRLAAAVLASRPAGPERGRWSASDADQVRSALLALIGEDRLAVGFGFAAAPGEVDDLARYMCWYQRKGERIERLRLNFDPTSIDVYDYLEMEWFGLAEQGRPRVAFGPYVDYSGADQYIVTATVPVVVDDRFVGIAGVDLAAGELERRLIQVLRGTALDAAIVSAERRVIAANTPRWVVGSRVPAMPRPTGEASADPYVDVAELPGGTGWVVALAEPDTARP